MNLHEYQSKKLFNDYGIPVPLGYPARSVQEAVEAATSLGGDAWMVKAQVHAGGRGKAGGVKKVKTFNDLEQVAGSLLGTRLVTHQTTQRGQPINEVLIESPTSIARELYLAIVVDRARRRVGVMASESGGMDIEEVAAHTPEKILTVFAEPVVGLQPYQCRRLAFALHLRDRQIQAFTTMLLNLYRLFVEKDCSLVEVNPLVVASDGSLLALDAKINIDDNALIRQTALEALHDTTQEDDKENHAKAFGLNYITLQGNIGCMVNGAGLAMATMDLIKLEGGAPANFLDVGGGTTAEKVAEAFKLIVSDDNVKAILVNIFGGIVRCDLIAQGIIQAVAEVHLSIPVVVRLEGTNAEQGRQLLDSSGLAIVAENDLTKAAQRVVQLAQAAS